MNIKDNLIFFFSFFPIFIIKSNFIIYELLFTLIFFFTLCCLNFYFLKILTKHKVTRKLYKSFIIVYGLDNHLGLFNGIIQPNIGFFLKYFEIIYVPGLLLLIILFILIFLCQIKFNENNLSKIFTITLLTILSFNIFDNTKSYKKVPFF